MPNFIKIEETFCGRTDGRTFETGFIRSTLKSQPNLKTWKDFLGHSVHARRYPY